MDSSGATAPIAIPLSEDHIVGPGASASVSLVRIKSLKDVNRLVGVPPLEFGLSPGLCVIFGDNGTGKSGFAQVIKRACRARGNAGPVKPNAFDQTSRGPASAELIFSVAGAQEAVKWVDGVPTDSRLSNIFVFDSESAQSHVEEDGPASFTPRGLDVLPKLAHACDELKKRFKTENDTVFAEIVRERNNWKFNATTRVGLLLSGLDENSEVSKIEGEASLAESDKSRLRELTDALKSNPKAKAQATRASAKRIREFRAAVEARTTAIADDKANSVRNALTECAAAEVAEKLASTEGFDDSFLAGTGGQAWRNLWSIAREFSTIAYPDKEFPVTEADAKCLLCQRPLVLRNGETSG